MLEWKLWMRRDGLWGSRDYVRRNARPAQAVLRSAVGPAVPVRMVGFTYRVHLPPKASCTEAGALTIRLPLKYLMLAVPPLSRQTSGRTVLVISATNSS